MRLTLYYERLPLGIAADFARFLSYHETIKAHSQKTVDEYFLDLRNFFRYLKQSRDPSLRGLPLNEISIMDVDLDFVKK